MKRIHLLSNIILSGKRSLCRPVIEGLQQVIAVARKSLAAPRATAKEIKVPDDRKYLG
jgi:hypothetical protein